MKQLLSTLAKYWKTIVTVFSICSTVAASAWGLKLKIEKKAIEQYSGQQQNEQMKVDVKETKQAVDSILLIVRVQGEQISTVIEKQDETKTAFNSLRAIVLDHQATTIEEFKKLNNEVPELKKNFQPIVYNTNQE